MSLGHIYNQIKQNIQNSEQFNIDNKEEYRSLINKVHSIVTDKYKNKSPEKIESFVVKKCTDKISRFISDDRIIEELSGVSQAQGNTNTNINENESVEERFKRLNDERRIDTFQDSPNSSQQQMSPPTTSQQQKSPPPPKYDSEYITEKEKVQEQLAIYLDQHNHSNDNVVAPPEKISKPSEDDCNTIILSDDDAKNQSKIRYDLAVPDEVAFGKAINVEKMLKKSPKLLILDSGDISAAANMTNTINLIDTLKLDQTYEMILEFITMQNITSLEQNNMLALDLIPSGGSGAVHFNTHSNINEYLDKYIFPNEIYGTNDGNEDTDGTDITNATSHTIRLKSNYMGYMEGGDYNNFTFSLYGNGTSGGTSLSKLTAASGLTGRLVLGILLR